MRSTFTSFPSKPPRRTQPVDEMAETILGCCEGAVPNRCYPTHKGHVAVLMHDRNHRDSQGKGTLLNDLIKKLKDSKDFSIKFGTIDKYPSTPQ